MPNYTVWAILAVLVIFYILSSPKRKAERARRKKEVQDQILRLFVPGEKLTGIAVSERLKERTGGRKSFPPYTHLAALVARGCLAMTATEHVVDGSSFVKKEYFLPD